MARKNKPRKWSNLKGVVPDAPIELNERTKKLLEQADARRVKEDGTPVTLNDIAGEWELLDEEAAFEEKAQYERNITYDALTKRALEELKRVQDLAGTDMWRGNGGHTFSPRLNLNVHVHDPAALLRWVHDTNQAHLLAVPNGRLKAIVGEAMNLELAADMTPGQRAALKPGSPGSGAAPPGVSITLHETVHHTSPKARPVSAPPDADEPF